MQRRATQLQADVQLLVEPAEAGSNVTAGTHSCRLPATYRRLKNNHRAEGPLAEGGCQVMVKGG